MEIRRDGVMNEFFKRLLGTISSICHPCDDPHKNEGRYRRIEGKGQDIV